MTLKNLEKQVEGKDGGMTDKFKYQKGVFFKRSEVIRTDLKEEGKDNRK